MDHGAIQTPGYARGKVSPVSDKTRTTTTAQIKSWCNGPRISECSYVDQHHNLIACKHVPIQKLVELLIPVALAWAFLNSDAWGSHQWSRLEQLRSKFGSGQENIEEALWW